jgi:hypothetical protein
MERFFIYYNNNIPQKRITKVQLKQQRYDECSGQITSLISLQMQMLQQAEDKSAENHSSPMKWSGLCC